MKNLLEEISQYVRKAIEEAGDDASLGKVGVSNRPDLCEFQCNGAMAGAKQYHKASPKFAISGSTVIKISENATIKVSKPNKTSKAYVLTIIFIKILSLS